MSKYKAGAYIRLSKEEYNDEKESNSVISKINNKFIYKRA